MPRYHFVCEKCQEVTEVTMSLGEYCRSPPRLEHCGQVQARYFPPTGHDAIENTLAGDRHYDGLRAQDGTDISSRSKHREYMKRHGLTTADDYKDSWAKAERQREIYRTGQGGGAITRDDIAREWNRRENR